MREAERIAFDNLVTDRLNSAHPDAPSDRCAWCGKLETSAAQLIPFGVGGPRGVSSIERLSFTAACRQTLPKAGYLRWHR